MDNDTGAIQWGPWVISGIALIQIWVIAIIRRLKKPSLDIFESGNIEVGYSGFGPTLGLIGTLRVLYKDVFIRRVVTTITKLKDQSVHNFNWRAFRPNTFSPNPNTSLQYEIASSFLLTSNNIHKYNIFFVDESFTAEIAPQIGRVLKEWLDFRARRLKEIKDKSQDNINLLLNNPLLNNILYDEFFQSGGLTNAYTILDRACYWEKAEYRLIFQVETTKPNHTFQKEFYFSLSDDDVKLLHMNSVIILCMLCGINEQFNFAFPEYKSSLVE